MSTENGRLEVVEGGPGGDATVTMAGVELNMAELPVMAAFAGVSADELELVLEILRSVTLEGAEAKILAGQFQLRVRGALESSR